jgi:hypothetical protein
MPLQRRSFLAAAASLFALPWDSFHRRPVDPRLEELLRKQQLAREALRPFREAHAAVWKDYMIAIREEYSSQSGNLSAMQGKGSV